MSSLLSSNVKEIVSGISAFAALKEDGSGDLVLHEKSSS